jgi:hypothetical protein
MKKVVLFAATLALLSAPAFAQGGSPYNSSGSQAGGPLAGQERRMGAPGGRPAMAPRSAARPMMKRHGHRSMHRHRHHRM